MFLTTFSNTIGENRSIFYLAASGNTRLEAGIACRPRKLGLS